MRGHSFGDTSGTGDHISPEAHLALSVTWIMSLGGSIMLSRWCYLYSTYTAMITLSFSQNAFALSPHCTLLVVHGSCLSLFDKSPLRLQRLNPVSFWLFFQFVLLIAVWKSSSSDLTIRCVSFMLMTIEYWRQINFKHWLVVERKNPMKWLQSFLIEKGIPLFSQTWTAIIKVSFKQECVR